MMAIVMLEDSFDMGNIYPLMITVILDFAPALGSPTHPIAAAKSLFFFNFLTLFGPLPPWHSPLFSLWLVKAQLEGS